ncbi:polyprenyl synthetase family protein [Paraherbaspirillum soli]|uniref:Polyprenyl synthetase family protein n=1 Tax=Paraherbaspirillum soli TaxID=631222 RepID=A0ABW0MF62_9BURK
MQQFSDWMHQVQGTMEAALAAFLPEAHSVPQRLHQAMRYAVLDGGKRVRPLLVFAAGALFDAPSAAMQRAAAAVEMIHAYSLVHDDMPCMDDDALRRGKPTVHVQYDEATALLVGDALQAQAFLVLAEADASIDAARRIAMLQLLGRASGSLGMCGGQAIDLASVGLSLSLAELEQMHKLKTGALLRASVLLGAWSGKPLSAAETDALEAYGTAIGLAFQVVDDILDATADSATLGKTAGKDAADNKPTYVSILGLAESKTLAEKLRNDAHQALAIFGDKARRLRELADLIVQRKA